MIPIYRAKKIDSDEYAYGCLVIADDYEVDEDEDQIVYFLMHKMENYRTTEVWDFVCNSRIDPATLAIHFPDMLDSQGNKIFASLNKVGKGGDILLEESRLMCNLKIDESAFREFTAIHTINGNRFTNEKILSDVGNYRDKYFKGFDIMIYDFFMMKKRNIKIIGVQK